MINILKLRDYQKEDVKELQKKNAFGVFSQQRTGKTPTSLIATKEYGSEKILIVCPASMIYEWQYEYERWLKEDCIVYDGQSTDEWIESWTSGLVISYGSLKSTATYKGQAELIKKHEPDAIIIDEAHKIKGRTTKVAKAVFKFKNTRYKLALTGTPAPNKIHDVWAILHFLYPKHFSSYWNFIGKYFKTTTMFNSQGTSFKVPTNMKPERKPQFNNTLSHITIQRKRKDVMDWLPDEPIPKKVRLPLTDKQEKYLNELNEWYETEDIICYNHLDRLMRYRQICLAPELLDLDGSSPKIKWIQQYIEDYPNKPTIIFSRFSSWLHLLKEKIGSSLVVYDGSVTKKKRQQLKKDFQNGKINILAIQIDAGKEGLTLDTAETTIFTDVYPPASDIEQAKDRFVPTSKENKDTPKQIITLAMRDSYDEKLYDLVNKNISITSIVNDYINWSKGE